MVPAFSARYAAWRALTRAVRTHFYCLPTTAPTDTVPFTILRYWPSKLFKVDNFYVVWKRVCQFLLVININLGPISHRFWDMDSFPLKTHIFPTALHSTPNLKMFFCTAFSKLLYAESLDKKVKSFPLKPTR